MEMVSYMQPEQCAIYLLNIVKSTTMWRDFLSRNRLCRAKLSPYSLFVGAGQLLMQKQKDDNKNEECCVVWKLLIRNRVSWLTLCSSAT